MLVDEASVRDRIASTREHIFREVEARGGFLRNRKKSTISYPVTSDRSPVTTGY